MRKLTIAVLLAAFTTCAGAGEINYETVTLTASGTTAQTATVYGVVGKVLQLHVILGTATNVDVDVTVQPSETTEGAFTLYSANDVEADAVLYPVFDRHSSAGAALTSDPPAPYICSGDPVRFVGDNWDVTNGTLKIKIVHEDMQ